MAKAFVNGIQIHYQRRGAGPDVILIHGITSCLAQWYLKVFPDLIRDYRVTIYDLRGHGLSDLTESGYTSLAMAEDLLGLMDHLEIEHTHLIGHSFGGSIALHLALLHPERVKGIVLLDTGLACLRRLRLVRDWPGWEVWGPQLKDFGITTDWIVQLDQNLDITDVLRQSLTIPVMGGFRKGRNAFTPRLKKLLDESRVGSEFREVAGLTEESLAQITTPVLAMYGEVSPYCRMAAHLSRIMPNCRYEVLEGAGHFYSVEDPGLVLERMSGFLRAPEAALLCETR
jgi:pimeloyl-ACP methyl ester carboxylesterase